MDIRKQALPGTLSVYFPPEYPVEVFMNPGTPPYYDGETWHFFSYGDVLRIMASPFEISYAQAALDRSWTYAGLWSRSGDVHRALRAATAHAYTPRALQPVRALIYADARALLAPVFARAEGQFEFITEFAAPLSIRAAARVMGLEAEAEADIHLLVAWMQANVLELQLANLPSLRGHQPLRDYVAATLARRTLSPQQPPRLIDTLIADQTVSDLDCLGLLWTQVIEASDTMASSLGYALLAFLEEGLLDALRADRALLPGACEEALRFLPAFPAVFRRAQRARRLGECGIAQGQAVTGWLCAANRDPSVFPDPHRFDIARDNQHQLAFGGGHHICLGQHLARLLMPAAFNALLDAPLPASLRLDPHQEIERVIGINNSLQRLPLRFGQGGQPPLKRRAAVAASV